MTIRAIQIDCERIGHTIKVLNSTQIELLDVSERSFIKAIKDNLDADEILDLCTEDEIMNYIALNFDAKQRVREFTERTLIMLSDLRKEADEKLVKLAKEIRKLDKEMEEFK